VFSSVFIMAMVTDGTSLNRLLNSSRVGASALQCGHAGEYACRNQTTSVTQG
jgi:hypothetical protein